MKRIALLFVSVFVGATLLSSQTTTVESLLKAKDKSDADIKNEKKNIKSATWEKRGDLFLDMAQFNTKGLFAGMEQKGITGAEVIIGKPQQITSAGNGAEDWIYERITLKFEGGKLKNWEETKPIDPEAIDKAYEAYLKADELDDKGKFKKKINVKRNIATLRGLFTNRGIKKYGEEKYQPAVTDLQKALKLDEFPKEESDTLFRTGLVTYYVGVIAQKAKDYETAKKYFELCIEKEQEGAQAYQALAALYKEMEKPEKELETLEAGRKKYPESKEILIGFINYYLTSGESDKALEQLTKAVKDNPENPTFHYAIGTLYDTMVKDSTDKYSKEDKAEYLKKAMESYKTALDIKPEYFEALYNLGALHYNEAARLLKEADALPLNKKKEYEAKLEEAKGEFVLAEPYMEKAHKANPKDRSTLQTLVTIYHKLQKYDKAYESKKNAAKEELDNLPTESEGL